MEGARLGSYRIVSELGSGGMGKVYLAEVAGKAPGLDDGTRVALKVIHPHLLETPGFFKRFLREAEIGKAVEQDNVVRCHDCDAVLLEGVQQNFLVMEYVEGQTLRGLLDELGTVPEELCRHVGREIAKGLQAIHEAGVVHRDMKPENVLITQDHVVKIMDLGVARLQDEAIRLSQTGVFVGSLEYAAPEQFRSGGDDADGRADLHALGVMLYELATGQHPYRDDDARKVLRRILDEEPRKAGAVNPQLSPYFEEVVQTLVAKDAASRFASAATLLEVLEDGEESEWWKERAKALRLETKRPLRRIRIPRETALYGRDDDLTKMQGLFDRAKEGDGQVLLIEGEAGIGKTRLVDELVGRLRQNGEDINFLFGSYPPGGAATAAGAFSVAYREQFGAEGLEDTLQSYLKPTPILIPAFAAILKGEMTPKDAESLTKDSLQTVFVHATRGLAAERTTVVLIDDLHFSPGDGRALFASLALAVPGHRILLIGTMRPGVPEDWIANVERLDHAGRTVLSRLGLKDFSALLKDALRSERLAHGLGMKIAEKSDGNPFFAFEIIRGLREGQFISQRPDGTWVTTKVIEDIHVPSSVLDLVTARVADLSEAERDLLDVACCCGFEFDPLLLGEIAGLPRIAVLKTLGQIERRHRLVRASGRRFVFDHHQVQEALYGGLSDLLKEEYHAAIAEALEGRAGAGDEDPKELDGSLCVDLCEHFLRGNRGRKALRYLDATLNYLWKGYLNDQVIELADCFLKVAELLRGRERLGVLLKKNDALQRLGLRQHQEEVHAEALALVHEMDDKPAQMHVETALGVLLWSTGRYDEAGEHHERARALSREIGDRQGEADATGNVGVVLHAVGRNEEAADQHERHLAIAREIGDRQREARAMGNLGVVLESLGRFEEAAEHHEHHLAIARKIGDRQGEGIATGNLGNVHKAFGRHEIAREHYESSLTIARKIGMRRLEAILTGNLGNVANTLGRYLEARAHYERSLAIAREIGACEIEAQATGNLALVCSSVGRYQEAMAHYERQIAIARDARIRESEAIGLVNLGELRSTLGQTGRAREALDACLVVCREIGARYVEGYALQNLAYLAHEEGETSRAIDLTTQALELRREIGHRVGVAESLIRRGEYCWRADDEDGARRALQEAADLLREQKVEPLLAHALALLACLPDGDIAAAQAALEDAGDSASTTEVRYLLWRATDDPIHITEAKRLLDYRVEHAPEEYRESMLKNVRLHREIMEAWEEHGEKGAS